jgi:glycosyltransferase involved in cell wall biosynthesis
MKKTTVLIPTYNRAEALTVTLTSLCFQADKDFDVIISDQSEQDALEENASFKSVINLLRIRGHSVEVFRNIPARGMAQQRHFLLELSKTDFSLFIDDDLILEPFVIGNLRKTLEEDGCGFAGNAVIGLSYRNEVRPDEQNIEFWDGKVEAEEIRPGSKAWERYKLHNAANIMHIQQKYAATPFFPRKYKIAWVGGCVMYDTEKLKDVGAFNFWEKLPPKHCGEDVLVQLRVMRKYGGCAIIPSGAYHQELKTTVPDRKINAPEYLEI